MVVQAALGKNQDSVSKITRTKRTGGMSQKVEQLPHLQSPELKIQYHLPPPKKKRRKENTHTCTRF
jgi:hypothetical protein